SHNMQAVARLCGQCLCLHEGQMVHFGSVPEGLSRYYSLLKESGESTPAEDRRPGSGEVRFAGVTAEAEIFRTHPPKGDRLPAQAQRCADRTDLLVRDGYR